MNKAHSPASFRLRVVAISLMMVLAACGAEAPTDNSTSTAAQQRASAAPRLTPEQAAKLHQSGLNNAAAGIASRDPGMIMAGIDHLQQAALGSPENAGYWLDLADAYLHSGIALEYPLAIDIYWMLLGDQGVSEDVLLTRLSDAYLRVGNPRAAFDAGAERLRRANPDQTGPAALHLALLTLLCDRQAEAAKLLSDKANRSDQSAYLLLLASSLQEVAGNPQAAVALIDRALPQLENNGAARDLALAERRRLAP